MVLITLISILVVGVLIVIMHNKVVKGFPTVFISQGFIILSVFIYVLFLPLFYPTKVVILTLILGWESFRVPLLIFASALEMVILRRYTAFQRMGTLLFSHNHLRFPRQQTIFLVNYPADLAEFTLLGIFPANSCLIIHKDIGKFLEPIFGSERLIFVNAKKKNSFDLVKKKIRQRLATGWYIFGYPERNYYTRKNIYTLNPFRRGLFQIAKDMNIPVTPVICDHLYPDIPYKPRTVRILDSIPVNNIEITKDYCWRLMNRHINLLRYKI